MEISRGSNETINPVPETYAKVIDREKYQIWQWDGVDKRVVAIYKDIAVATNLAKTKLYISTTGINGNYDTEVVLNSTNFPGLIGYPVVENVFLMPWTRNRTTSQGAANWRMVVTTNYAQVYHNFPSRAVGSDGAEVEGDIAKFEESVIWDLPERKYPSTDPAASGVERYFPCLPTAAYIHHPLLNTDVGFIDTYGNGGFGLSKTVGNTTYPRFYRSKMNWANEPLITMGGFEPGDKVTLVGTYVPNNSAGNGGRICVFATDDGGRQWYCKYEFAEAGSYPNWSNDINTTAIATAYTADSFQLVKKSNVYPSLQEKEPTTKFTLGSPVVISDITRATVAVVTTATPHGLVTGNIIAIQDNSGSSAISADWDWMRNDTISTTSGGNGVLFKVEKIDDTSFKLHEEIHSAYNNLPARHIHHINRIKDGWIIGSGEQYPGGWLLYINTKASDSTTLMLASDTFSIYRLNSTKEGIQRSIGCIMLDDADNTIIFASDISNITRANLTLPTGRTDTISRGSTGIFSGKLVDIDDFTKFTPILEAKEVAYFFKEKLGAWFFCGQRGEFAISFDKGATWETMTLNKVAQYFYGENSNCVVIDDFIIVLT